MVEFITIKVIVLCTNAEGSPEFSTREIQCTQAQYDNGDHYDMAKEAAEDDGYESPMMAFDENDSAARQLNDTLVEFLHGKLITAAEQVRIQCGDDFWAECSQFPRANWRREVENGDTVAGYWDWIVSEAEAKEIDLNTLTGLGVSGSMATQEGEPS